MTDENERDNAGVYRSNGELICDVCSEGCTDVVNIESPTALIQICSECVIEAGEIGHDILRENEA